MSSRTDATERFIASFASIKRAMISSLYSEQATLSHAQVEVLSHVAKQSNMSIKEIAALLHITPSAITQLVEPLVKNGCILRNSDPSDRRSVILHISPAGKKELEKIKKARAALISELLEPLSEAELDTFISLLEKLAIKKKEK